MHRWRSADLRSAYADVAGIPRLARENLAHQGLEGLQRLCRVARIERALVPIGAKIPARPIPAMLAVPVASVAVAAQMMRVVIALEEAVLLDDPRYLRPHERAQGRGRDFRVIEGRHIVADVVNERCHDHLDVRAVAPRAGCRLQRM